MKRVLLLSTLALGCLLLFSCAGDASDAETTMQNAGNEAPGVGVQEEILPVEDASQDTPEAHDPDANEQATIETTTNEQPADEPSPGQPPENSPDTAPASKTPATGEVVISFEYTRQSGPASNQHAVWIEDMDGNLIKSLFASRWTANGGYRTRPDSIALWAERAGLTNMSSNEVDAVAGATPRAGLQSYTWDLTDLNGETVPQGDYMFFVEGTLRWKNFVLFSGTITVSDDPATVEAEAIFHYEDSERYAALTSDSTENNMIGPVTAIFTP